ncbi:hypothetical protein C5Y96_06610 [Blastopirellula marina]|uniref:Uncharacterized protein n=1 Tax=Blastopirellula marina TaxID=124 RepID=A0A2S8FXC6_9BACT|nr:MULTISPECIES: hypothetical protein [Pirellulaceae]PQO36832.1 hypothetical protein C5Y96_06610 [Blastopirellula marina]RCS53547.1 hypothetical protein DTL36_06620 [Bremerella cremea]
MSPKPKRKPRKTDTSDSWIDRAPLISIIHWFLVCGMAIAIITIASGLLERQLISSSAYYGATFTLLGIATLLYFFTGHRRRKRIPEDEQYYCEICHRVIKYRQRQRTLERFPDKHFQELCQRCREIVFMQASWEEQQKAIHRGVLPLFLLFSLACLANIAFSLFTPLPEPSRQGLVEAELQVLRFEHGDRMLVAIYNKQEVSLYLPGDVDLRQKAKEKNLQQGDFVTALIDDKVIVELSQNGQPIFTFADVKHEEFISYIAGIVMAGLFATVPIGWYLYWEHPRANQVLQTYREKLGHYPQDVRQQLEARTRF